jgi:DNA (cytosine-5)-methyltransferase 1
MKFGGVCSGIEAASVAWHPLGWRAAWLAEIEPFPSAVLAHHYPDVPNLGDMTALPERIQSGEIEAPDVFCGGTPCQAFSVAGLRNSLDDARGNLSLTFVGIANAIDTVRTGAGQQPAIVFWENVPGVLSTKDNAFGCFLAGLAGEDGELEPSGGKWTNAGVVYGPTRAVAWRVLDAQYFGVAQRRRRVFVVASARDDFDPAAVLFEFDGVRRDIAPSRQARETTAHATAPCLTSSGRGVERTGDTRGQYPVVAVMQPFAVANCLTARMHKGINSTLDEGQTPVITRVMGETPCAFCGYPFDQETLGRYGCPNCEGEGLDEPIAITQFGDTAGTRTARHDSSPCADREMNVIAYPLTAGMAASASRMPHEQGALVPVTAPIAFSSKDHGADATADLSPTLRAMNHADSHANGGGQMAVAFQDRFRGDDGRGYGRVPPVSVEQIGTLETVKPWNVAQPIAFHPTQDQISSTDGTAHGLGCGSSGGQASVAVATPVGTDTYNGRITGDVAATLGTQSGDGVSSDPSVMHGMAVRRLTPVECERLQGFPDNYSQIPWRKKPASECPDGPRYKALGNSWAVPVVSWIGRRIAAAIAKSDAKAVSSKP